MMHRNQAPIPMSPRFMFSSEGGFATESAADIL